MPYELKVFIEVDGRRVDVPEVASRLGSYAEDVMSRAFEEAPSGPQDPVEYRLTVAKQRLTEAVGKDLPRNEEPYRG